VRYEAEKQALNSTKSQSRAQNIQGKKYNVFQKEFKELKRDKHGGEWWQKGP